MQRWLVIALVSIPTWLFFGLIYMLLVVDVMECERAGTCSRLEQFTADSWPLVPLLLYLFACGAVTAFPATPAAWSGVAASPWRQERQPAFRRRERPQQRAAIFGHAAAMLIRRACTADDAELLRIDVRSWSWFVGPQPPGDDAFFASAASENVLVAEVEERPVGYVKLGHRTDLASNRHVLEIYGLAVDPCFRHCGIGQSLMEAAIDEARRRGAVKLGLRVFGPNIAAQALYRRCGFEVVAVLRDEFRIEGRSIDDVLMELRLS